MWDWLHSDGRAKKIAWKMLREFQPPEHIASEFGPSPEFIWNPEFAWNTVARTDDDSCTKLLLESNKPGKTPTTRCEAVALYPAGRRADPTARCSADPRRLPRATACISSQPGCGVGCPFCATGSLGYRGNLSSDQIAEQVYWAGMVAAERGRRLRNVVYMGMGEPLHNLENVLASLELLTAEDAFGIPERRITLSTVGVPQAMVALVQRFPNIRLALSLHAAEEELRRRLVPRALGDLELLRKAIRDVNAIQPRHGVWLEVVLFQDINDRLLDAKRLREFCKGLRVEVNLIPYNAAGNSSSFTPSNRERREAFAKVLRTAGIRTTIRTSLGQSQRAACGQLSAGASSVTTMLRQP